MQHLLGLISLSTSEEAPLALALIISLEYIQKRSKDFGNDVWYYTFKNVRKDFGDDVWYCI